MNVDYDSKYGFEESAGTTFVVKKTIKQRQKNIVYHIMLMFSRRIYIDSKKEKKFLIDFDPEQRVGSENENFARFPDWIFLNDRIKNFLQWNQKYIDSYNINNNPMTAVDINDPINGSYGIPLITNLYNSLCVFGQMIDNVEDVKNLNNVPKSVILLNS